VHTAQSLSDIQEWEKGEATFVLAALGPIGLETVDTLIMTGIAATRAEAIRWSLERIRERPEYQRLSELRCAAELMDRDVLDTIEREIDEEVRARFPGSAVRQAVLLQYGDDPEIEPGDLRVRVLLDADGPEGCEETLTAFRQANTTAIEQSTGYLAEKLREIRLVEYTFSNNPVTREGHGPRASNPVGSDCRTSRSGSPARPRRCWRGWDRLVWKRWTRSSWRESRPHARRPSGGPSIASASGQRTSGSVN
jgi:hypothetical protein